MVTLKHETAKQYVETTSKVGNGVEPCRISKEKNLGDSYSKGFPRFIEGSLHLCVFPASSTVSASSSNSTCLVVWEVDREAVWVAGEIVLESWVCVAAPERV